MIKKMQVHCDGIKVRIGNEIIKKEVGVYSIDAKRDTISPRKMSMKEYKAKKKAEEDRRLSFKVITA